MESKGILEIVNEIESKIPVQKWSVEGMDIWPYIRFKLGSRLSKNKIQSRSILSRILNRYIYILPKYLMNNIRFLIANLKQRKIDYLFIENGVQVTKIDGSFYYTRTDSIRDILEEDGAKCQSWIFGYRAVYPLSKVSQYLQYSLDFEGFLRASGKLRNVQLKGYDEFLKLLKKKGIYNKEFELENLYKQIKVILRYERFFEKKIGKIMPKAVFILCYYSIYGYALIYACKKLNIPVIDIQHGVQGEHHFSYGTFINIPSKGYNLLPDYFYVWSDYERNAIERWSPKNIKVLVGGNSYLDIWRDSVSDIVVNNTEYLRTRYCLEKYSKVILFTVHPEEGGDKETVKVIRNSPPDWFWFVRLHPKRTDMLQYVEKEIGSVNCSYVIKDVNFLPLYALLKVVDVHVTARSSTIIEGIEFGVKTVLTNSDGERIFKEYIEMGFAEYAPYSNDIIRVISNSTLLKKVDTKNRGVNLINLINGIKKNV